MREKLAAVKQEQSISRVRLWRGSLRPAFERVSGRKLQDVIPIGGIRRLSEEGQRTRGKSVMMRCPTTAVMQNQTNAGFVPADQELVIGIERSGQRCQPESQRRARSGIKQQRAPADDEPGPIAAFVGREIHSINSGFELPSLHDIESLLLTDVSVNRVDWLFVWQFWVRLPEDQGPMTAVYLEDVRPQSRSLRQERESFWQIPGSNSAAVSEVVMDALAVRVCLQRRQ